MKIKHNKKRNTAFVYEALIREGTSAILQKDEQRCYKIVNIIKKHFKDDSVLKRDLECYRSLYENQNLSEVDSVRIIKEARAQKRLIDPQGLFIAQTELIHDINKEVESSVFNNFVPNYKSLANIYHMFSDTITPKDSVILENLVMSSMVSEGKQDNHVKVDSLVVKTFIDKFNKAKSALSDEKNFTFECKDGVGKITLGHSNVNTNRISIAVDCKCNGDIEPISFSAEFLKEILNSNRDAKSASLKISTQGLAHLNFEVDSYKSEYYLVQIQS